MLKRSANGSYILLELPYGGQALPGQFFTITTSLGPYIPRPFSVYDLKDGRISFLIKSGGEIEKFLDSAPVIIDGPFGNPLPELKDPLLISGGVGYAPIHFYISKYGLGELVAGFSDEELFDFVDIPDHSVSVFDPVTPVDVAEFSTLQNVIACGPVEMLKIVKKILGQRSLYLIMEEKMACARGMCEGCAIMTSYGVKFVCKDGPTFKALEVDLEWTYL
ncbi:MAG: hypothetical protein C0176_08030 [Mesoaciditoga sp.]|uniref:iron-sulfur cluster-binding protein n=1 Tax=Athalassotoga sp. TaxID=2022597 RepID=UPI000CCA8498|nr:MAG: hypothetical protein C0176_08030 [Mesoaciditoga sp.]HEU25007.1 hypothetical protein [Mesoaciditoga lauensis]